MRGFDFPGNVRQLENTCHWLTVMAPAQVIEPKDLLPELLAAARRRGQSRADAPAGAGLSAGGPHAAVCLARRRGRVRPGHASRRHREIGRLRPRRDAGGRRRRTRTASARSMPRGSARSGVRRRARLLDTGSPDVWDQLSRQFEGQLIRTALTLTRGRRIEAAQKLGIGRNTITRKIQDLGLDD